MAKTTIQFNCDNCGSTVTRLLSEYKRRNRHFCCLKCQKEYIHRQTYEDRPCENCGTLFHTAKKSKQRFCSTQCQNEWQRTITGKTNPRYNRVELKCSNCGKAIHVHPCKVKAFDTHFCNENCRREWYSEIWSQRAGWKEQSKIRAVKILSSGAVSFTNSKPQIVVNEMLGSLGIKYINEYDCKYYAVDNYLVDCNLMIEVMGDFWHTNPIKYTTPRYKKQIVRISRDKAKETYILNKYNIRILYLWESDINEQPDMCLNLIISYIEHKGKLQNYHSFNYEQTGNGVSLKPNIIVPLFERDNYEANAQPFGA